MTGVDAGRYRGARARTAGRDRTSAPTPRRRRSGPAWRGCWARASPGLGWPDACSFAVVRGILGLITGVYHLGRAPPL